MQSGLDPITLSPPAPVLWTCSQTLYMCIHYAISAAHMVLGTELPHPQICQLIFNRLADGMFSVSKPIRVPNMPSCPQLEVCMVGVVHTYHPAMWYMQVVDTRDVNTLLFLIRTHTLPSIAVHSDQWSAYSQIVARHYMLHSTVNHNLDIVYPSTGMHTRHWRASGSREE